MMRQTVDDKKQALINGLTGAHRELLGAVRALPADCPDIVFLGVWSVKDLVAHLVGWDETNLQAVQSILAGHVPEFFRYFDRDWQSYNRSLVEKYRKESLDALLTDAEESHQRFITYLTSLPAGEIVNGKVTSPTGRTVTVRSLLKAETDDEKKHAEQVKVYFKLASFDLANL